MIGATMVPHSIDGMLLNEGHRAARSLRLLVIDSLKIGE
jgi:hypothetical protein